MHAHLVSVFSVLSIAYMLYSGNFSEIGIVLIVWAFHRHWVKVTVSMSQGNVLGMITQNAIAKKVGVTKEDLRTELRHQTEVAAFSHTIEMLRQFADLRDFKDDAP